MRTRTDGRFTVSFALGGQAPPAPARPVTGRLPAGSSGVAAIFTEHVKASHVIRQVLLRQTAILNYVNPL